MAINRNGFYDPSVYVFWQKKIRIGTQRFLYKDLDNHFQDIFYRHQPKTLEFYYYSSVFAPTISTFI